MEFSLKATRLNSVSIIIVNYNAGPILADSVKLSLEQSREVIVVDNASSDESVKFLELTFGDDPRLNIIYNNKNIGFSAACNMGARVAVGKYFLFLNPDCLLQNNTVIKLVQGLELYPDVGMVGGMLLNVDGTEQAGGRRAVPTPWRSFVRTFGLSRFSNRWPILFNDFYLNQQPLPDGPIDVEAISGACMMVKNLLVDVVGEWDDTYFLHCEDLDLCMRYRQKGWRILFVPNAPVIHYLGVCSASRPIFVEWHKHKGMIRFYKKFFSHQYPGMLMWFVLIGVWFRFVGVIGYYSLRNLFRWLWYIREK